MTVYRLPFGLAAWPAAACPAAAPAVEDEPGRSAGTSLSVRLPVALRRRLEASAALEGVPFDVWLSRAVARSVDPRLETT